MDHYRGSVVIDDPHAGGKAAYACVEIGLGAHAYWMHMLTADQVRERIARTEKEVDGIGSNPANGTKRQQRAEALKTLAGLRRAVTDLVAIQTFEGMGELKIKKSFNRISGVFKNDGQITVNVPERGLTVLTALRHRREDGSIIRRYEDARGLDRLFHVEVNRITQLNNSLARLAGAEARAARNDLRRHEDARVLIEAAKDEAEGLQRYLDRQPRPNRSPN